MLNAFKGLLGSKKFWLTITGTVCVTVMQQQGMSHDIIVMVAGFFGVNIAGQGLADLGKESKK